MQELLKEAADEGYVGVTKIAPFAAKDYNRAVSSLEEMWEVCLHCSLATLNCDHVQNVVQMHKSLSKYGNSESSSTLLKAFLVDTEVISCIHVSTRTALRCGCQSLCQLVLGTLDHAALAILAGIGEN